MNTSQIYPFSINEEYIRILAVKPDVKGNPIDEIIKIRNAINKNGEERPNPFNSFMLFALSFPVIKCVQNNKPKVLTVYMNRYISIEEVPSGDEEIRPVNRFPDCIMIRNAAIFLIFSCHNIIKLPANIERTEIIESSKSHLTPLINL